MRVYGASFWFILPTETRLVALAANCSVFNCPSMCVAGLPVTTWERKNYGQFTTVVLEVRNIAPANRVIRQNTSQYQAFILKATDISHIGKFTLRK